jgi:hypothetical protein
VDSTVSPRALDHGGFMSHALVLLHEKQPRSCCSVCTITVMLRPAADRLDLGKNYWLNLFFLFVRLGLVGEKFLEKCHIRCFVRCRKGFSDTNKKTNYIACMETTRRIY